MIFPIDHNVEELFVSICKQTISATHFINNVFNLHGNPNIVTRFRLRPGRQTTKQIHKHILEK